MESLGLKATAAGAGFHHCAVGLRPALRAMQHSGDLDRIYENAVNDDVGQWCKHQLSSSIDAA